MGWYVADVTQRIAYLRQHVSQVVLALFVVVGFARHVHDARRPPDSNGLHPYRDAGHGDGRPSARRRSRRGLLCPAGPSGDCAPYTSQDGVHVNPGDAPVVLNWLLDSLPVTRAKRNMQ